MSVRAGRSRAVVSMVKDTDLIYDSNSLITTVVQDATTGDVLMVAWMNRHALRLTQETGEAHFWSRSRNEMWHKGATSGSVMRVREIVADCDRDTLLIRADPTGPACHTGSNTCFQNPIKQDSENIKV